MGAVRRSEIFLLAFLTPIALIVLISPIIFRAYWIPTGSMKPTLLVGDYLLVNRAAYGFPALMCNLGRCDADMGPLGALPDRGDVVTFSHPVDDKHYIKRVVGLPGDRVQVVGGRLHLNGEPVAAEAQGTFEELYVLNHGYLACDNAPLKEGDVCIKQQSVETLPEGRQYKTINIADGLRSDDSVEFLVPEGHVFVMGDNRDNSMDSRFKQSEGGVGFVPLENMIGRADLILLSLEGIEGRIFRWVE